MDKEQYILGHVNTAITQWLKSIEPQVLNDATVTAAATPFINLEAVLAGTAEWLGTYRQQVTPHLWALILASTVDALDDRQVGISAGIEPGGELTQEQQAIIAEAVKLGAAAETAALVIQLPTWHDFVTRYVDNATNKVVGMPEETYRLMLKALNSAQLEGEGIFERARITRACLNIKDEGGYTRWQERAVRIARTETNNAMNGATYNAAQIEQELTGETLRKAWLCVAPDTVIGARNPIHAARRTYEGTMITISTTSGTKLTLTPEHPILTGRGWIPAKFLNETDNLFRIARTETTGAPHIENRELTASEIIDPAIDNAPAKVRAVCGGMNLNDDTSNQNVDVVPVDSVLAGHLQAVFGKDAGECSLPHADTLAKAVVFCNSGLKDSADRLNPPSVSLGSFPNPSGFRGRGFSGGTEDTSLGLSSNAVPSGTEDTADNIVADIEAPCDSSHGFPGEVAGNNGVLVKILKALRFRSDSLGFSGLGNSTRVGIEPEPSAFATGSDCDTCGLEATGDSRNACVVSSCDSGQAGAFRVFADNVVHIERDFFVGHVYDLETAENWYEANGLIVHNCTLDDRTRDSHFEADGQIVPLDGKFEINGYECDHPGDQTLPAAESINCRCSLLILGEGEELPGEHDRQTERERSDGTTRNPANEVARRAERGITRARDNSITASATGQEKIMRTRFTGVLAPIGERTGDGRAFDPECVLTARATPLPLQWQKHTNGGHDTAVIVGKIDNITVTDTAVEAEGVLFDTPEATEAKALIEDGVIRPSVDLVDVEAEYVYEDKDGNRVDPDAEGFDPDGVREVVNITAGKVAGATLVSTPAFENTAIILGEQVDGQEGDTLVASVLTADTLAPVECFRNPGLEGPTALTVTDNGRVFGHLALWGTKHIGGNGATPPHSNTGYALFHVSTLPTTGGSVSVGRLTVGCGHADTSMGMRQAAAHYDTVGSTWAFVKAGEDEYGIWVAGVVNPTCDPDLVRMGAASPLSGDWRRVGSNLELVAALSVNVPGFPVPRSYSAREDSVMSLVAAGVPTKADTDFQNRVRAVIDEYEAEKFRAVESRRLAARVLKGSVDVD